MYLITGSTGLIGSSCSEYFLKKNIEVLGIDNDLRSYFFGKTGSNKWKEKILKRNKKYNHYNIDIRNKVNVLNIFKKYLKKIDDLNVSLSKTKVVSNVFEKRNQNLNKKVSKNNNDIDLEKVIKNIFVKSE